MSREILVEGYRYILALRKELQKVQNEVKELEKEYNLKKSQNALKELDKYDKFITNNKLFVEVDTLDSNLLKDMATALRNNKNLDVVLLAASDENKVTFVCATKGNYNASNIVKEATKITGGGGGGKPDLAQAGGKNPLMVDEALNHVKETLK